MAKPSSIKRITHAAANSFRDALQTVPEPSEKWTEVLEPRSISAKSVDLLGQRARAVNEYSKPSRPMTTPAAPSK